MSSENLLIAILFILLLGITLFPQELLAPSSIHDDGLFSFSVGNISRSNYPFTPRCVIRQHAGNQHAAVRYSDFTLLFKRESCLPIGSGFLVEARLVCHTSEPKNFYLRNSHKVAICVFPKFVETPAPLGGD